MAYELAGNGLCGIGLLASGRGLVFVAVLKPENTAVKIEGALQASHLQMHMPDADVGIDRSFLN